MVIFSKKNLKEVGKKTGSAMKEAAKHFYRKHPRKMSKTMFGETVFKKPTFKKKKKKGKKPIIIKIRR